MDIKNGKTVRVHFIGTLNDGTEFENSHKKGPMKFVLGNKEVLTGFENAVRTMSIGEKKNISLSPSEAYGEVDPEASIEMPKNSFTSDLSLKVGSMVYGDAPDGRRVGAKIISIKEDSVVLDFNHPMAGKDLNFEIELLSIE